jgi:hypothetical protein
MVRHQELEHRPNAGDVDLTQVIELARSFLKFLEKKAKNLSLLMGELTL